MLENNPSSKNTLKKKVLATALTTALGVSASASADQVSGNFSGLFTLLAPAGAINPNSDAGTNPWFGYRTEISGAFDYDIATGLGSMIIAPFSFFGGGAATASSISFQNIGDGSGGSGTLFGAQMRFNWSGTFGIPVTDVFDAAGFLTNLPAPAGSGGTVPVTINSGCTGCSTSTTTNAPFYVTGPTAIGPVPMAMTTFNTAGTTLGSLFPLSTDGVAGSPMTTAPFPGQNAAFDLETMVIDTYVDTTPPDLTRNGAAIINLNVGDTYTEPGATCTDAVDGSLTAAIGGDTVDTNIADPYTVTYDCEDNSTNAAPTVTRTVNVIAAGDPAITLLGTTPEMHEAATPYTDDGATCDDGAGNDIPLPTNNPPEFFGVTSPLVDVDIPGNYPVTYECTNSGDVSATPVTRTVNVVDTTKPVIMLTPNCDSGITVTGGPATPDPTPTASCADTVDGDLTSQIVETGDPVDTNPDFGTNLSEIFNLGYSCTDSAINMTIKSCQITVGNPVPVATLVGDATVLVDTGADYVEEGATCDDFTDGPLDDAVPDMMIDGTTPVGKYTITYTCGPNSLTNTGTTERDVFVGVVFSGAADSGSTFVMINPSNSFVGGADDVFFSWDGSLYTDPVTQTAENMFMGSAEPQPFFGFPWFAHDIRAFAPGDYVIPTSRGNTLDLHIGPNQIGAHMLFDWSGNDDIDVVLTWDINGVFLGSGGSGNDLGAKGQSFGLAVIDADGDGLQGTPMADGPFAGFNACFNVQLSPLFALPDAAATAVQDALDPVTVISSAGGTVTVTATVNPSVNGVYSYGTSGFSYDWSMSDATLLGAETGGPSTTDTFEFDPSGLADGPVTAIVKVIDNTTGLTSTVMVPLEVTSGAADGDADADGVPDSQDVIDNTASPTMQQGAGGILLESSAGKLVMGDTARAVGVSSGTYGTTVADTDLPPDAGFASSCIGGCNSFDVVGIPPGSAVDVTIPLTVALSDDAVVRMLINGVWRDFIVGDGNAIMSALGAAGDCSVPGAFSPGLTPGNFCLKLTYVEGSSNDADSNANGTLKDPVGVAGGAAAAAAPPGNVGSPNTGGCSFSPAVIDPAKRADWTLMGGVLTLLGFFSLRRRRKQRH